MVGLLDSGPFLDDAGEPDLAGLRRLLAPRVDAVARLRQRVHFTRWGQGLPVWVDCPVDLDVHVRRGPRLDGDAALVSLCEQLLSAPLARDRPLWDLLVCPGPTSGQVAVVLRLHHAVADGVSGVRMMRALFDPAEGPGAPAATAGPDLVRARTPHRAPSGWELALDAWRTRGARVLDTLTHLGRLPSLWRDLARGAVRTVSIARGAMPSTSLLGPLGARRSIRVVTVDLAQLRSVAHTAGATVNDALLSAAVHAAGALLVWRGEPLPPHLPVSVPVSLRDADDRLDAHGGNQVGVMRVLLPLGEDDAMDRLRRIAATTRRAKSEARAAGTLQLTRSRLGIRAMDVIARHQRSVGMFITNVPGPSERLSLGGAQLLHAWPLSIIAGDVRFAVAALSYAGGFSVTLTVDAASCPDVDVFAHALEESLRATQRRRSHPA